MKSVNIGIVGASGLVGKKILELLHEYNFNINEIVLYGSKNSANTIVEFNNKKYKIIELSKDTINDNLDIVFFAATNNTSLKYCHEFTKKGIYVIDNSSAYRLDSNVSLVVPEVNAANITRDNFLIANPNCTTIQGVVILNCLSKLANIKRVDYTSYQAVSGSGYEGINDLVNNTTNVYPYQINNNLIPLIDLIQDDNYSKEEHKMINETRKILNNYNLEVSATCIRVPIKNTHGLSIKIEFEQELNIEDIKEMFKKDNSIILVDDAANNIYPIATLADGKDEVFVGRIKKDIFNPKIIHLFCVADNVRKGAASNSIQIAQYIIDKYK